MSEGQNELPQELENQFILRLPPEHASTVRKMIRSGNIAMKDKLKIDLHSDGRHAVVQVEDVSLNAKLVDLPCVVASLKTLDKKSFYKTADISQMLVCTTDGDLQSSPEQSVSSTDAKDIEADDGKRRKKYNWKHGITPPLKNVRKRRFRKIKKKSTDVKEIEEISFAEYTESPDVEKEVKRLLCSDAEAVSARWEVIADGETGEIESQGTVPSFEFSSGMTGHKRGPFLSAEYEVLRELFPDYSSDDDDDDDDEKQEEEEEEPEEYDEEEEEKDDSEDEDEEEEEGEEENKQGEEENKQGEEENKQGEEENKQREEENKQGEEENKEEEDSEEDLKRELQAKFTELGHYEAKEAKSLIVMELQKQICDMEKTLKQTRGRIKRQVSLINKVEHSALRVSSCWLIQRNSDILLPRSHLLFPLMSSLCIIFFIHEPEQPLRDSVKDSLVSFYLSDFNLTSVVIEGNQFDTTNLRYCSLELQNEIRDTHLQFVLEQLKLQEKEKIEQLISLQKQLKYVLEK
ncbi:transcription initiation factor TFIID subunit 7-like [Loxodonta africana]|uniref:transcription initiation factor TFIID subunit 7-like n=1 Tax=Loxodonta africana TaxID=9785 RepID=UPI0030CAF8D2